MPYELGPEFLAELFTKHAIDYVVHGDDPCLLPDGSDAYAYAKKQACAFSAARHCELGAFCRKEGQRGRECMQKHCDAPATRNVLPCLAYLQGLDMK